MTTEGSVVNLQSEDCPEDTIVCRSRSGLGRSEMTGIAGEGSTTAGFRSAPVGARYTGSESTGRIGEWFVAGDGWRCHAIEAGMFVDREQDFEWVGGERDEEEGEGRGQEWSSMWAPTDAGADAGMVIGLSCRTKIRLVNDEVAEVVEMANLHIHLGTKQATLHLGAD